MKAKRRLRSQVVWTRSLCIPASPAKTRGLLFKFSYLLALLGVVAVAVLVAYLRS